MRSNLFGLKLAHIRLDRTILQRRSGIVESALLLMSAYIASNALGVVRQTILNALFGTGPEANAFYAAAQLPNTLFNLIAGGALRNEFYAAYAPGDDRGTVKYKEQRFRGLHPAAFTYDEWQKIRAMTQSMHHASTRTEQAKHVYQFAGYISCIHCGLKLRCDTGNTTGMRPKHAVFRAPPAAT